MAITRKKDNVLVSYRSKTKGISHLFIIIFRY